jgi:hypothetical protein
MMNDRRHPLPPIGTYSDVAIYYNVSERTVQRWHAQGLLVAMNLPGRLTRFTRENALAVGGYADPAPQPMTGAARPA